ncbi:MAG: zf-HC2 domain-containing protein [Nitrospirota bacterium]
MTTKQPATTRRRSVHQGHAGHGHSKAQCIKVLRRLSAYLDKDLSVAVCKEIRKHLGACPNCEVFIGSLRQAIALCRHVEPPPLTPALKARLRIEILKAAGRS